MLLATLATFVVGVSALVFRGRRDQGTGLRIDAATIRRDVGFFLVFFTLAAGVGLIELPFYTKVALALALAFGLGGRDVAARMLEGAYLKGQASREQVRHDLAQGRERAQADVERAKTEVEIRSASDAHGEPGSVAFNP